MFDEYSVLTSEELTLLDQNSKWFKDEVGKVTTSSGKCLFLVPNKRISKLLDRKRKFDKKLEELLLDFDFNKVREIMESMDWTWYNEGLPKVKSMKDMVRTLYNDIIMRIVKKKDAYCACGGFKLQYYPEDEELTLIFEAITSSVFYDN